MKSILFIAAFSCGISHVACADKAANDVFVANADYGLVVGHNTVKDGPCAYHTSTSDWKGTAVGHLNYGFNSDVELLNGASPGLFNKDWFSNQLVNKGPGLIEKVLSGAVTPYRVEVDYNRSKQITAIRSFWAQELDDECVFNWDPQ